MARIVIESDSLRAMVRTIRRTQHELDGIGSGLRHVAAPRPGLPPGALAALGEVEDVVAGLRHTAGALEPWARELQRTADFVDRDDITTPSWIPRPRPQTLFLLGWPGLLGAAGLIRHLTGGTPSEAAGDSAGFFAADMRRQFKRIFPWVDADVWDAIETVDDIFETLFDDLDKIVDAYCDASQAFYKEVADFVGYLPTAAVEYAKGVAGVLTDDPSLPWYGQIVADLIPYTAIPRAFFGFGRELLEGDVGGAVLEGAGLISAGVALKAGWAVFRLVPAAKDVAEVAVGWGLDHVGVDEWINERVDDFVDFVYEGLTGIDEAIDAIALGAREFSESAQRTVVGASKRGSSRLLDIGHDALAAGGTFLQATWRTLVDGVDWLKDTTDDVMEALYEGLSEIVDRASDIANTVWRETTEFVSSAARTVAGAANLGLQLIGAPFLPDHGRSTDVSPRRKNRELMNEGLPFGWEKNANASKLKDFPTTPSGHLAKVEGLGPGQLLIERICDSNPPKYVVYLRGMEPSDPYGSSVHQLGIAARQELYGWSAYEDAVVDALRNIEPPIGTDAELALVGHSQGGIAAVNLAASGRYPGKVTQVLTAGSPVSDDLAEGRLGNMNVVALQNNWDFVPRLRDELVVAGILPLQAAMDYELDSVHSAVYDFSASDGSHDVQTYANALRRLEEGASVDPLFDTRRVNNMERWMRSCSSHAEPEQYFFDLNFAL